MAPDVLSSRRAKFAKWKFPAAVHGVCEITSLETWCLQMSRSSQGSRLHAAGRSYCWFGVRPQRGRPLSVCSFIPSLFDCLSFSISYPSPSLIPLLLPFPICFSLFSFIRTSHSTLLCPCYHGYCLLQMRWGFTRTDGRYSGPCDTPASHRSPSFSPLFYIYLSTHLADAHIQSNSQLGEQHSSISVVGDLEVNLL